MNERRPLSDEAQERLLEIGRDLIALETPRVVGGRYRIIRELGRGAMGVVLEAEDLELRRRVALKLLAQPLAGDAQAERRFVREAQALARLKHPHIAAVYDAGPGWIALELIDGAPLSAHRFDDARACVALLRDAAFAVHHAHELGVIHRDLKPSNLLVEGTRVVVTDFGLAKDVAIGAHQSLSGGILGTPAYMAPEQARGENGAVDARTDVYGLGATLYELLGGRPPFVDRDAVRLMKRIVEEQPRRLVEVVPSIARDLDSIVGKCLEKAPGRRYSSARKLGEDLIRYLDGESVRARPPSPLDRGRKFLCRHWRSVGVAAILAVALFASTQWWIERRARSGIDAALEFSEEVHARLEDIEQQARNGAVQEAQELRQRTLETCEEFLQRNPEVAQAHFFCGVVHQELDQMESAITAFDRTLAIDPHHRGARMQRGLARAGLFWILCANTAAPKAPGPEDRERLRAAALADLVATVPEDTGIASLKGRYAQAEMLRLRGEQAARQQLQALLQIDPAHVQARRALSQVELSSGNPERAWHLAMSAVDLYSGFGPAYAPQGPASPQLARVDFLDLEGALADLNDRMQARPDHARTIGLRGAVHTRRAAQYLAAGDATGALQALRDAIADYGGAITLDEHLAGAWNNRGLCQVERSDLLVSLGRDMEADAAAELARVDLERALALNPRFALARLNRALLLRHLAERAERRPDLASATRHALGALEDLEAALQLRPTDVAALVERSVTRGLLALISAEQNDTAAAERQLVEAEADLFLALLLDPGSPDAHGQLGIARLQQQRRAEGIAELERALKLEPDARTRRRFEAELAAARD